MRYSLGGGDEAQLIASRLVAVKDGRYLGRSGAKRS
jgi:hypothetical protein